jgi:hypothetical protein
MANLLFGRRRAASEGKLAGGAGRGMLGYTLENKKFITNSFISIVDEILDKALQGESMNGITRALQKMGVIAPFSNKVVTRATVASVLRNAKRYAGIWHWGGYELRGLIPPRISEEQSERILDNLKRNHKQSLGFGKRKWLTSRVICGVCGRRYALNTKSGCVCYRSDPMVAQPPCPNLRVSWKRLSHVVWDTFIEAMTSFEALELCIKDKSRAWKTQKAKIDRESKALEEHLRHLEQKRRQYSWQQAEGIITDDELRTVFKQIQSEESVIKEQMSRLEKFSQEPSPMDVATFKKLAEFWPYEIMSNLHDAPDDVRARFAGMFDLCATIRPDGSQDGYHVDLSADGYHVDLSANIPLEMEGDKPGAYDMVFGSSGCLPTHAYEYLIPFVFSFRP